MILLISYYSWETWGLERLNNSHSPTCTCSAASATSHRLSPQTQSEFLINMADLDSGLSLLVHLAKHFPPYKLKTLNICGSIVQRTGGNNLLVRGKTSFEVAFLLRFCATLFGKVSKGADRDSSPLPPLQVTPWQMHLIPDLESYPMRSPEVIPAPTLLFPMMVLGWHIPLNPLNVLVILY